MKCHHEFTAGRMNSEWAVVSIVCLLFLSKPSKTKPQSQSFVIFSLFTAL